jgi:hypothetical protein
MKKDRKALQDELRELSPRLADLQSRGDGQTVPPGYFDQLEGRIFQRIEDSGDRRTAQPAKLPSARIITMRWMTAVAASLSLVLGAWWFLKPSPQPVVPGNYADLAATLTAEDAEAYIMNNLLEFETITLVSYVIVEEPEDHTDTPAPETKTRSGQIDLLSTDELDLLLREMSDEELEAILL